MRRIALNICFLLFSLPGLAQQAESGKELQVDSLHWRETDERLLDYWKDWYQDWRTPQPPAGDEFIHLLEEWYSAPASFDYIFPSLTGCTGQFYSRDSLLKFTSWNKVSPEGEIRYYAYIQYRYPDGNYGYQRLDDVGELSGMDDTRVFTPDNWYGALYYDAIPFMQGGQKRYLILGLDYLSTTVSQKMVDVLVMDAEGGIRLGHPAILLEGKEPLPRKIYRFSGQVSMVLRYEPEHRSVVMDHLSPSDPRKEGDYAFYGPDFTYDALSLHEGYWRLVRNVDARNPGKESYDTP